MKKKILLLILFCSSFAFGQKTTWGAWEQNPCYKGIWFRVKLRSYNSAAKQYEYDHEFKSTYNVTVTFTYDIKDSAGDGRTTIKPGQTSSSWNFLPYNGRVNYSLNKVCFHHPNGFDQCSEYNSKGYASFAECDNGTPNYKIWDGNKNSNSPNNNNSKNDSNTTNPKNSSNDNGSGLPTAQQNQQSEIHRQQEQNRIIQESNNRRQQYVNVYNEGVDLGNSGKHAEAAAKYQEAIGLATNEQERQQAQNAYDRISKTGRQTEAINQLGQLAGDLITQLQADAEKRKEKKKLEAQEKINKREETWDKAIELANQNDIPNAIIMMLPYAYGNELNGMQLNAIGSWYFRINNTYDTVYWFDKSCKQGFMDGCENYKTARNILVIEKEMILPTETDKPVESSVTKESILDNYFNALGGLDRLKTVQNIIIKETDDREYWKEIKIAYGKYSEKKYAGLTDPFYFKRVFNGKKGYIQYMYGKNAGKKDMIDKKYYDSWKKNEPLRNDILELREKILEVGKIEELKNEECYTLIYKPNDSEEDKIVTYYFNSKNSLLSGKKTVYPSKPNEIKYTFYEDYKNINDILLPHTKKVIETDGRFRTNKIEIKLDQSLTEIDFE